MTALPTRKLEAFRYTDLRALAGISFAETTRPPVPADLPDLGIPRLVFLNGVFDKSLSSELSYLQPFVTVAEGSTQPLALINAEHAQDGITLAIPPGVDAGTLLLVSHAGDENPVAFHPRHRITLGAGAKLTVIEIAKGDGVYWHNPVTDIALHEGAVLAHYRLQDESKDAFHLATIRAKIAENAA